MRHLTFGGDDSPQCFRNKPSCHMYADSEAELHVFAEKIGLKKSWFQRNRTVNHYDLTPSKRVLAIRAGALEHNCQDAVAKWRELRSANAPAPDPSEPR